MTLDTHVGYKLRLFPTKEQEKIFYEYFRMTRFVYNKTINLEEEQYQKHMKNPKEYKRLTYGRLTVKFTNLKKSRYKWLNKFNAESIKSAIRDCTVAYSKFDDKNLPNRRPRFKNQYSNKQFSTRADRLIISNDYITLSSIGDVKYCNSYGNEIIGCGNKDRKNMKYLHYCNTRISYDGLYFYLSFTLPKDENHNIKSYQYYEGDDNWKNQQSSESIGIDVGLINDKWLVDSTGKRIERPDSTVLNKRISRLERKYERQRKANLKKDSSFFEHHPDGSKNMQKTRSKINKDLKKISNRRKNKAHDYSNYLLRLKPKNVIIESVSVNSMIIHDKNINYSNTMNAMIRDAALYETMTIIERKLNNNGIQVIKADKQFPSSQICSCCGNRQNIGRAKYYRCPICGTIIDRDLNAAINLSRYEYIKDKYS